MSGYLITHRPDCHGHVTFTQQFAAHLQTGFSCPHVEGIQRFRNDRVACNLATDRLRQWRPWSFISDAATELEQSTDPSPGLDVMVELRANLEALDGVLESLPHRHRGILMNLRVEGLSRQEVAERHRISLRSVDTVLRQALDYCRAHMGHPVRGGVSSPRRALPKMRRSSNARTAFSAGSAARHPDAPAMPGHLHDPGTHD